MITPDIETCRAGDKVFWQYNEDNGVGEPAILVQHFSDTVCLHQKDSWVHINYDTIPALVKLLNTLHKEKVAESK